MLSLRIAWRYLFSRKSHSAVNIITFISMTGVMVSTIAVICVLSVFNGFSSLAERRMSMLDPELEITSSQSGIIVNSDSIADVISTVGGVKFALPTLTGQALAVNGNIQLPVKIKGVPQQYDEMTGIRQLVIDGEYLDADDLATYAYDLSGQSMASLSVGVASRLSGPEGFNNHILLMAPRRTGRVNPANPLGSFTVDSLLVSSVFQVDETAFDNDLVIIPLDDARMILEYDDESSQIEVALIHGADIKAVRKAIAQKLGSGWTIKDRLEQQAESFKMIQVEKWISFLLLAFIFIIASFNIVSTLSILIIEKKDNISTLSFLGAPRRLLTRIFMIVGWLVSAGGGLLGIIIGTGLCLAQQHFGLIKLAGDSSKLSIDAYPVRLEASDLLAVAALLAAVCLLSTLVTRRFIRARV